MLRDEARLLDECDAVLNAKGVAGLNAETAHAAESATKTVEINFILIK
jgi:hypothetical protein